MRTCALLAVMLTAYPIAGSAQIGHVATFPGGSNYNLQVSSNSRFAGLPGSVAGSTGTLVIRELNVAYGIMVGTTTTSGAVGISTPTGTGNLRVRGGSGVGGGTVPVLLYSWTGSSTTQGTVGVMVAGQYTLPANTILNVGDTIRVFCLAVATTTSLSKDLHIVFGGDDLIPGSLTTTGSEWRLDANISYKSASNFIGSAFGTRGTGANRQDIDAAMPVNPAVDNAVRCMIKGTTAVPTNAGDEDMELLHMTVWLDAAP